MKHNNSCNNCKFNCKNVDICYNFDYNIYAQLYVDTGRFPCFKPRKNGYGCKLFAKSEVHKNESK